MWLTLTTLHNNELIDINLDNVLCFAPNGKHGSIVMFNAHHNQDDGVIQAFVAETPHQIRVMRDAKKNQR